MRLYRSSNVAKSGTKSLSHINTSYDGSSFSKFYKKPSDDITDSISATSVSQGEIFTFSAYAKVSSSVVDSVGSFSFFSSNTHTIFPPTLEVVWDDSTWTTGSLDALTSTNLEDSVLYMKGLRKEYKENSRARFRVVGRERFPTKTYSSTPAGLTIKYLPSGSSYYSISDAETDDVIVPFGSGSKISCDSTGNYFNLDLNGYQPERYYTLQYRVVTDEGTADELDQYYDEGFTFKVSL